jgi:hypothetical protein
LIPRFAVESRLIDRNPTGKKEESMKLSAPKVIVWWIALIIGLIAIVLFIGILKIAVITPHVFWIMTVAWVLLIVSTFLKGL